MKTLTFLLILFGAAFAAGAQVKPKVTPTPSSVVAVKASAAYAELILQRAELSAELESLLVEYTDEYPRIRHLRVELGALQKEIDRLFSILDHSRLTAALGKLMVRKARAEVELWALRKSYKDDHPDVVTARKKVEVFESAIREIVG
jgi:uncharacterized protein involved in exopolysaccharide biosynthesis